jgi:hypothetical protein
LANYAFPELVSGRVIHPGLTILVREFEGGASASTNCSYKNVLIGSDAAVLLAGDTPRGALCEATGWEQAARRTVCLGFVGERACALVIEAVMLVVGNDDPRVVQVRAVLSGTDQVGHQFAY